jgi:hypothetical protein
LSAACIGKILERTSKGKLRTRAPLATMPPASVTSNRQYNSSGLE